MKTSTLSVNDVLRFANHDYMNQIQLLKMNLDLGRIEEAKSLIENFQSKVRLFQISIN